MFRFRVRSMVSGVGPVRLAVVGVAVAAAAVACGGGTGQVVHTPGAVATGSAAAEQLDPPTGSGSAADAVLAGFGLAGLDARQLVDRLDAMSVADRPAGLMASVRPRELVLSDSSGRKASLPMPKDDFYLSVAPYVAGTHDCHFHSLTTCKGELGDTEVEVTVRDQTTGAVLVHGRRTTFDNGFLGLWLPRGITATITVESQGRQAVSTVSTGGDDEATCLTTMQLR